MNKIAESLTSKPGCKYKRQYFGIIAFEDETKFVKCIKDKAP